jgi:hypothetical protein
VGSVLVRVRLPFAAAANGARPVVVLWAGPTTRCATLKDRIWQAKKLKENSADYVFKLANGDVLIEDNHSLYVEQ